MDFAGDKVADLDTLKYSVNSTGENNDRYAANLPNRTLEIDPGIGSGHYSSMVYIPAPQSLGLGGARRRPDSQASGAGWYMTNGTTATNTGCTQANPCTLAHVRSALPDATICTLALAKGKDYAFSGAVDKLVVNGDTYDCEPTGVTKR